MITQPRAGTGHFATNGTSSHEKHRFHTQAAHIQRVEAAIARYNEQTSQAETHEAVAVAHERLAASHLAAALKT